MPCRSDVRRIRRGRPAAADSSRIDPTNLPRRVEFGLPGPFPFLPRGRHAEALRPPWPNAPVRRARPSVRQNPSVRIRPIFPRFYEWLSVKADVLEREHRAEVAGGARGRVLELGAGNGLNFEHYRDASLVVAVEPQPGMLLNAVPRAAAARVPVRVLRGAGEALPFRDGSFDTLVVSLVLCSVREPRRVVEEIRRVLSPGGEVRLFEHVRSDRPWAARAQSMSNLVWSPFAGGCRVDRDTPRMLREAGFTLRIRRFPLGPPTPARPHVIGTATRP